MQEKKRQVKKSEIDKVTKDFQDKLNALIKDHYFNSGYGYNKDLVHEFSYYFEEQVDPQNLFKIVWASNLMNVDVIE